MYPPARSSPTAAVISTSVGLRCLARLVFLTIAAIRIKLLDTPREYAVISINPKGVRNRMASGETPASSGVVVAIAAKANPVDHAENSPHPMPNPGINIGSTMVVLCRKMPNASMSLIRSSNSFINMAASSWLTADIEPI